MSQRFIKNYVKTNSHFTIDLIAFRITSGEKTVKKE